MRSANTQHVQRARSSQTVERRGGGRALLHGRRRARPGREWASGVTTLAAIAVRVRRHGDGNTDGHIACAEARGGACGASERGHTHARAFLQETSFVASRPRACLMNGVGRVPPPVLSPPPPIEQAASMGARAMRLTLRARATHPPRPRVPQSLASFLRTGSHQPAPTGWEGCRARS